MKTGVGPFFPTPLTCPADLDKLDVNCDVAEKLGYVFKAITLTRTNLEGNIVILIYQYIIQCLSPHTLGGLPLCCSIVLLTP